MDNDLLVGIFCTTAAIVLLLGGIVSMLFIGYRKRLQQNMKLAQLELSYEKELRQVENEVGEQMMERFAQELHDSIGHELTCIRMQIENRKLDNPMLEEIFLPIEGHLNDASQQLRLLSRSLNTDYVSNLGLARALEIEVQRLRQLRRLKVSYEATAEPWALNKNQELMVFRICQEMIHNSLRHSKANHLKIAIIGTDVFELEVCDDGKGFDVESILNSHEASGLKNIMKRAALIGMDCSIKSSQGAGCSYRLTSQKPL